MVTSIKENTDAAVWDIVLAHMSQLSTINQRTWGNALAEWCENLGTTPGQIGSGQLMLSASFQDATRFMNAMKTKDGQYGNKRTKGTIQSKYAKINACYNLLMQTGVAKKNPLALIRLKKSSGTQFDREMMSEDLVIAILNLAKPNSRDLAILSLMFGAGLRASEIVKLRSCNLIYNKYNRWHLMLYDTKNGEDEPQPIADWIYENLRHHLESEDIPNWEYMFKSQGKGGKAAKHAASNLCSRILKKYCKELGVEGRFSSHTGRATLISKLLDEKHSHYEIQKVSRHKNINMIQVYDKRRQHLKESIAYDVEY